MKTTRLTTYWDTEQVIVLIGMIDDLRQALLDTYQSEIEQYQHEQWLKQQIEEFTELAHGYLLNSNS